MSTRKVCLGDRLHVFMEQAGLNVARLAKAINRSPLYIRALMTGFVEVDKEVLLRLCEALRVNKDELQVFNDWDKRRSRTNLDHYCRQMGLSIEDKCLLALEASKPSRMSSAVLHESHWNSLRLRLLNKNLPLAAEGEYEPRQDDAPFPDDPATRQNLNVVPTEIKQTNARTLGVFGSVELTQCRSCGATISIFTYECPECRRRTPDLMYDQ